MLFQVVSVKFSAVEYFKCDIAFMSARDRMLDDYTELWTVLKSRNSLAST